MKPILLIFLLPALFSTELSGQIKDSENIEAEVDGFASLRDEPSISGNILLKLSDGTKVLVLGLINDYWRIEYERQIYYCANWSLQGQGLTNFVDEKSKKKYSPPKSTSSSYKSSSKSSSRSYKSSSRRYIRGPRGGCYYINSNGNKTYVSRSLCN